MRNVLTWLLLLLIAPSAVLAKEVRITVLQLNDVYTIAPVDKGKRAGFDRIETLRQRLLAQNPNTVFVLGGDTLSPSVASNMFRGEQMIQGWNAVHLDLAVLGNHEFDFGDGVLLERMKQSRFVWLGSNVVDRRTGDLFGDMPPCVIREIGGVRVGFFGLLTPDTLHTSKTGPNVDIRDPIPVAREAVKRLRQHGAQVVVALTHLDVSQDRELAREVEGIDLICGGHEHTLIQTLAGRTPIFKWGSDARLFGKIDLMVEDGRVRWLAWEAIPLDESIPGDPQVAALIQQYEERLNQAIGQPIGRTDVELNALQLDNRQRETNLGDFIADAYRTRLQADVAFLNGGSVRSNQVFPPGTLTRRDILTFLPFENPVVKVEVPGRTLRQAMEHGLSQVGVLPEFGAFPQISGMTLKYDARLAPGARIVEFTVGGRPLEDERLYTVASNSFVIAGGDGYAMFQGARFLVSPQEGPVEAQCVIEAVQAAGGSIAPRVDGRLVRLDAP
ncbi:MAG: bifunctional UDP-sugar hydrolase/5'-nucleotidase [Candidatus Eremiobacterota bacterium]